MASLLRRFQLKGRAWKPLVFSNTNFPQIPPDVKIEEENFDDCPVSWFYPARIGEVIRDRYQIVAKLGYGITSTVWLARDLEARKHVALKLYVHAKAMGAQVDHEVAMYKRIQSCSDKTDHPGRHTIRQHLDSFDIVNGTNGSLHRCLVHAPLWENMRTFLHRNPVGRLPPAVLAFTLHQLFSALDFLHTECQIIHTDIKSDNIMFGIPDDDPTFKQCEDEEMRDPSPRKVTDEGRIVYESRTLSPPSEIGPPVLCDFGSAVMGNIEHTEDIQPDVYRSPEVILEAPWSNPVDIWNVGCMVWNLFEGGNLFTGHDPELQTYRSRAHLAEIIALLGDPPESLLKAGKSTHKYFTETGEFKADIPIPERKSLQDIETTLLEGGDEADRAKFLALMSKMLQWDPSKRASARELMCDDWVLDNAYEKDDPRRNWRPE